MSKKESNKTTSFGFETVTEEKKTEKVKEVFDSVATNYDLMNDMMSMGVHRLWKRFMLSKTGLKIGMKALDVAGGTGDIAALLKSKWANRLGRDDRHQPIHARRGPIETFGQRKAQKYRGHAGRCGKLTVR